ncbi:MAG: hypothetical protein FJX76_24990 [Armatimonadetes bacterium]|nr:hypothetical protein [Armatimonadota bacterium]
MRVLLFLLVLAALTASDVRAQRDPPRLGVSLVAEGEVVQGLLCPGLCVAIVNNQRHPIALRRVTWTDYPADERPWLAPVIGDARRDDEKISLNPMIKGVSKVEFERGLLLPGEKLVVPTPMTPQADVHEVKIEFVDLDRSARIFFPQAGETVFVPLAPDAVRSRAHAGRLAVVDFGATPQVSTCAETLKIPLRQDHQKTGGASAEQAARAAGITFPEGSLSWYRPALGAWIFCLPDQAMVAAARDGRSWKKRDLPKMSPAAPDLLGAEPEGMMRVDLPFGGFEEIRAKYTLKSPEIGAVDGKTLLPPRVAWDVLNECARNNWRVKVTTNPYARGLTRVLEVVKGDAGG